MTEIWAAPTASTDLPEPTWRELQWIHPASAAMILGAVQGSLGLAGALFLGAIAAMSGSTDDLMSAALMPVFYAAAGAVGGWIGAVAYDAIASVMGGIEVELRRID